MGHDLLGGSCWGWWAACGRASERALVAAWRRAPQHLAIPAAITAAGACWWSLRPWQRSGGLGGAWGFLEDLGGGGLGGGSSWHDVAPNGYGEMSVSLAKGRDPQASLRAQFFRPEPADQLVRILTTAESGDEAEAPDGVPGPGRAVTEVEDTAVTQPTGRLMAC